jgi:hypothetical protein
MKELILSKPNADCLYLNNFSDLVKMVWDKLIIGFIWNETNEKFIILPMLCSDFHEIQAINLSEQLHIQEGLKGKYYIFDNKYEIFEWLKSD